tara:strand:- start:312312 stop:315854 length:3543 start_codon:yes stop_codon:yes gene_type:complete
MLSPSNLLSLALLYVCTLFAVAWYADRQAIAAAGASRSSRHTLGLRAENFRGVIYGLSLAVYCSSWTFYGAVGSASASAWGHAPIYLGPILLFVFGWPLIRRLLAVGARHRVTSIADYIGARYGKRQSLAVLVTLVATAAVLPYIALQFKALAQAWTIVGGSSEGVEAIGGDTALLTAIILAVFTILFGTRRLDGSERHQGVMAAIALESVVKLVAFIAVAVLALSYLAKLPQETAAPQSIVQSESFTLSADFLARTLISGLAILCLPRQFHVMVVEAQRDTNIGVARWLFPLYLALFMFLVIPISMAGGSIFGALGEIPPDTYVQLLPIALESDWVAVAAFIGGISAATGMVIVATVALAIMITNEVVAPLVMRLNAHSPAAVLKLGDSLRRIRQFSIAGILLAAWLVTQLIMEIPWLAQIGFISFLAAAQLAPALIAGLYWRRAHGGAVIAGLLAGIFLWFYCGVLPAILPADSAFLAHGPMSLAWLRPMHLLGVNGDSTLAYATGWSLGVNTLCVLLLSLLLKPSQADLRQARLFTEDAATGNDDHDYQLSLIRVSQLQALLPPFMDSQELSTMWQEFEDSYQQRLLPADRAPNFVVHRVEAILASIIGATSAHRAMTQLEDSQQLAYSDLAGMVSDASKLHTFNRELLQTTVESLIQGVSVVDAQLRLVAWNKRYEEIFNYPQRFLYVGCPIERVYRFNAERGILGGDSPLEDQIEKRLAWLREGNPHRLERVMPDGSVIDIRGTPLPHGGFVSTYIDITDFRDVVVQLEEAKIELEAKVASGSQTLTETNTRLRQENRLRAQVEAQLRDAHNSKSRFMSATSHDLLQPINAARLFTASLKPQLGDDADPSVLRVVGQIDSSLHRAEQLIAELREIARLDSGRQLPRRSHFSVSQVLDALQREFLPMATMKQLGLRVCPSTVWLYSDQSLVYRILQNLVGNAIKYTASGRVLVGVRRRESGAEIQVLDTGPGIDEQDQMRIFDEFERLHRLSGAGEDGLGLGLALVQRYADLLGHRVTLQSLPGQGTLFSLTVSYGQPGVVSESAQEEASSSDLEGISIVCLDNDPMILEGMKQLLGTLGASVQTAVDRAQLQAHFSSLPYPDIVLADYHLDDGDTGLNAVLAVRQLNTVQTPCVIISADDSDVIRDRAKAVGFRFMPKPVNAARLRALVLALVRA